MNIFKSGYWCVTVQGEDDMGLHRGKPRLLLGQAMGMSPGKEAEKGAEELLALGLPRKAAGGVLPSWRVDRQSSKASMFLSP